MSQQQTGGSPHVNHFGVTTIEVMLLMKLFLLLMLLLMMFLMLLLLLLLLLLMVVVVVVLLLIVIVMSCLVYQAGPVVANNRVVHIWCIVEENHY